MATAVAPAPVVTPRASNLKFLKASEVRDAWGLNMLVYGQPGVGKSTLCSTAQDTPAGAPVLFIDVEGGVRSIADRHDIDVFRPDTFKEIGEVYQELLSGNLPYKTVVIDSITEAQALGMKEVMRTASNPDWPGMQEHGKSSEKIVNLIRAFRALAQSKGINVIFTAHEIESKDESTGRVLVRPALSPKAMQLATGAVDTLAYMSFSAKDGKRVLHFKSDGKFLAKVRQPAGSKDVPDLLEDPTLVDVLNVMRTAQGVAPTVVEEGADGSVG